MASTSLQQAIDAIQAGHTVAGKRLLVGALQADPFNEQAWLWLAAVYDGVEQRRACLQRALAINPENDAARRALSDLDGTHPSADPPIAEKSTMSSRTATAGSRRPPPAGGVPTWNEQAKHFAMRRLVLWLGALVAVAWGVVIGWVILSPPMAEVDAPLPTTDTSLFILLAPILVASAAIERVLEATFDTVESNARALVAFLGRGLRWLKSAETEVQNSRQWLADVSIEYRDAMQRAGAAAASSAGPPDDLERALANARAVMDLAERRLDQAERTLAELTTAPRYRSAKSAATIMVGMLLGVIVAVVTGLQMFALLGIGGVPAKLDAFLTGLIIGSGAYPVHSLVGILQQLKNLLDSAHGSLSARSGRAKSGATPGPSAGSGSN